MNFKQHNICFDRFVMMSRSTKNMFMLLALVIYIISALKSASSVGEPGAIIKCKDGERQALLKIKEDLSELDQDGVLSSWGNEEDKRECCKWIGIRCDNKSGHVIRLDLSPSTLRRNDYLEVDRLHLIWKGSLNDFTNLGLLRSIDLSSNKLTGEIPHEITQLVGLVSLNLSRNNISGEIPTGIGQLKSLDVLDLSKNLLSGRIPSSLSQVSGLSTLDLSNNSLSGKIPTGTQLQTRDAAAYLGNPDLCGEPLSKKCPGEEEPTTSGATKDHVDAQEDEDRFVTKGFYISTAIGFIAGFWGFCFALIFNKSWRYRYFTSLNTAGDWLYVTVALSKAKLLRIVKG